MHRPIVLSLLTLQSLLLAQPEAITGRVVDDVGRGIASAEVWLIGETDGAAPSEVLAYARTGEDGAYTLQAGGDASALRPSLVALAPEHALAARLWREEDRQRGGVELVCGSPTRTTGRITDQDGVGVAARIVPTTVSRSVPRAEYQEYLWRLPGEAWPSVRLPRELGERLSVETDATGHFELTTCPEEFVYRLTAVSSVFGEKELGAGRDCGEVVLSPAARLTVRVACPEQPEAVAGLEVRVVGEYRTGEGSGSGEATTDAAGVAVLPPLQPGLARVRLLGPVDARWQAPATECDLKPGEATELQVRLQPAFSVTGRVTDAVTGRPAPGVEVIVSGPGGYTNPFLPPTGGDGVYRYCTLPGKVLVRAQREHGVPVPYTGVPPAVNVDVAGEAPLPDIVLRGGPKVTGLVVDQAGRPVARAEVLNGVGGRAVLTDAGGRFSMYVHPPTTRARNTRAAWLWGRAGEAMALEPVPALEGEDVKLTLTDNAACRVTLRAVDDRGAPVAGAEIVLGLELLGREEVLGDTYGVTDAEGYYRSPPLWPRGIYTGQATKPGLRGARSVALEARPGAALDLGTVRLLGANGALAGRVVGPDDMPVPWAAVSAGGEGPADLLTRTDAEGRFRLTGLDEGTAWTTAVAGGMVGAVRAAVGATDVEIRLGALPRGAPLVTPGSLPTAPSEQDLQAARELMAQARERFGDKVMRMPHFVEASVLLGPETALDLGDDRVRELLAVRAARSDPDVAAEHLEAIRSAETGADAALRAARAAAGDPVAGPRLAAVAVELARKAAHYDHRGRARLCRAAEVLWEADPTAGEPVLREAQAAVAQTTDETFADGERRVVAEALCRMDLPAALATAEGIGNSRGARRCLLNVAERLAPVDPQQAEALLERCRQMAREDRGARAAMGDKDSSPYDGVAFGTLRIVYAMAPVDTDRALRIARAESSAETRARYLAYVALALTPRDPRQAAAVLDEALAGPVAAAMQAGGTRRWPMGHPEFLVEMAVIAGWAGHPGVECLCQLALACRPPEFAPGYLGYLAVVDPGLAADLARDEVSRLGLHAEGMGALAQRSVVAAAVGDARLVAELLHSLDTGQADRAVRDRHAMLWGYAVRLLAKPPRERQAVIIGDLGMWVPGERDMGQ